MKVTYSGVLTLLFLLISAIALVTNTFAHDSQCRWNSSESKSDSRYTILNEGLLDQKTCLIWNLPSTVNEKRFSLSDAFGECARNGSRNSGGIGVMGWRLPSVAELTSLDVFSNDSDHLKNTVNELGYWTSSLWPPSDNERATVTFSNRGTAIVIPSEPNAEHGVICVK